MNNQISLEQIKKFKEVYDSDRMNKVIENAITKNGVEKACISRDAIIENQPVFNIELPESKRYDQQDSHKCWIFSGLNLIKYDIAKNLNMNVADLELSNSYIAFYDKLEKSNNTYENIINLANVDYDYIHKEKIITSCVNEGGYWEWFEAIIDKYGVLPYSYNPDAVESTNFLRVQCIYTEKVKKDILKLIELKRNGADIELLRENKNKFLQENYILLCKLIGEPLTEFNYEYKDKSGEYHRIDGLTPIEFKNRFLKLKLEDFVTIGNFPMYNKEFNKVYRLKYEGNVRQAYARYLNLPIEDLKELTIKQLKDGVPVYMGAHIMKFRDTKSGVLDTRLYDYADTLNFETLSKEEALNLRDICMHHAMSFVGVNLVDGVPQRWKIEDSYGDKAKVKGCYVMNDNFFSEFVLSITVDKKYLSAEQLECLKQEPIEFAGDEPF